MAAPQLSPFPRAFQRALKPFVPKTLWGLARDLRVWSLNYGLTLNDVHVRRAAEFVDISNARVLVVGANTGEDCRRFVKLGCPDIHGLDVEENVGANFRHRRATYHRMSIEDCALPSATFDMVFSFATMEHVPNVKKGFREMARLLKPGGTIYCVASPLWNSPYGHHAGCFVDHPWIHIALDRDQILEYAAREGVVGDQGRTLEAIVDYMLNPMFFNMRPASDYRAAVAAASYTTILEHRFHFEEKAMLEHKLGRLALTKGYSPDELLSSTHEFIARR